MLPDERLALGLQRQHIPKWDMSARREITRNSRTQELLRLEQKQWRNGSFHRSKHELVFVFKVDSAAHTNTFGLGDTGRYRTNVWDYAGVNSLRVGRAGKHP
jgi:hypothetical protein